MKYPDSFINKIVCADCIDGMKKIPDNSIDLIITSAPYNIRQSSGGGFNGTNNSYKWKNAALGKGYDGYNDKMPHEEYVEWQRNCLTEMMRLLKDDGAIFYNHKWRVQNGLMQDRQDIVSGFPVRQIIIWQRAGGINFNDQYFVPTYEVIYMICKPKFKLIKKANGQGDVWKINQVRKTGHPAPFPIELPLKIIASTSAKVILDPFVGSGTTALAAVQLNRQYIGIERSKEYCEMAENRINAYIEERDNPRQPEIPFPKSENARIKT